LGDLDHRLIHTTSPSAESPDAIDQRIIGGLLADGRVTWTDLAKQQSLPLSTVQRRGAALLQNGDVVVKVRATHEVIPPRSRVFECRVRCVPGTQRVVAAELAARSDIRWVAVITGEYDIALEVVVPDGSDVADAMIDAFGNDPNIVATESSMVIESFLVAEGSSTGPLDSTAHAANHDCDGSHLDHTDLAILAAIQSNGRKAINEISEETGFSSGTVRRRLNSLLANGCAIVMAQVRPTRTLGLPALLRLRIEPKSVRSAAEALSREPRVRYVATLLGRSSVLCEYIPTTTGELETFVYETISSLPGIIDLSAEIIIANPKRGFVTFDD
jgi:DNA-binding Lrp family transcriptional regulator